MIRIAALCISFLFVASCGDDPEALGTYADSCDLMEDCEEGLTCILKVCTSSCSSNDTCLELSNDSVCSGGTCYIPCQHSGQCPSNLVCTQSALSSTMLCKG